MQVSMISRLMVLPTSRPQIISLLLHEIKRLNSDINSKSGSKDQVNSANSHINGVHYNEDGRDVGQIFIRKDVQEILKSITRFEDEKIFTKRPVKKLESPKLIFMTNKQLEEAKKMAYESVKARIQFPPVMKPTFDEDKLICYEPEIQGFIKNKVIFVDIAMNNSDRSRLMSVREPSGLLRFPTFNERSRMNYLFFPNKDRSVEVPKAFEKEHMQKILDRGDYVYLLNRACLQFEPNDPQYIQICCTIYDFIDKKGEYEALRSTRHFGPMSLFFAYYKRIDNLLVDMLKRDYVEDAANLVKLYYISNEVSEPTESLEDLRILKTYVDRHCFKNHLVEPALQATFNKLEKNYRLSKNN